MTKIDIFSGFLGAGKTTLIKKLINEAYKNEKLVLIENEFGEIGIDGGFLKEAGIEITEMNSGCICCSLVGDFDASLKEVLTRFNPDRILIEPSGVGKLSDVIKAVSGVLSDEVVLNSATAVVDAVKCKMYMKNFGEFFGNQIENADCIILSRTDLADDKKIETATQLIREKNQNATLITTPIDQLKGADILSAMEKTDSMDALKATVKDEHNHEHHHHEHNEDCDCGCHGHHHEHDHEHHHHHEHGEDCDCGCHGHHHEHDHEHHHHHEHDEDCNCGCHGHHHEHDHEHHHHHEHSEDCDCGCHGHHHADDVFASWGKETSKSFSKEKIQSILEKLDDGEYGAVLRAKGYVKGEKDWIYFDYVPGQADLRSGAPAVIGRICVIGADIDEAALNELFELEA